MQVNYKKIDKEIWEKSEEMDKLLEKEKEVIENVEILTKYISQTWNIICDIFKKVNDKLPKKKGNPNKETLPKTIIYYKRFLNKLSYVLFNLMNKKIR